MQQNLLLKQLEEKQWSMKTSAGGRTSDSEVMPGSCCGYSWEQTAISGSVIACELYARVNGTLNLLLF